MSQTAIAAGAVLRLSIVSEDRRLDVGVPAQVPLIELLPGFARRLGMLDPSLAHGGYVLNRADGSALDPARGIGSQGVHDGELLTLVRGGLLAEARVYDDVVEAVIDATSEQHGSWTPRDSSRTALAVSVTFLALCALLLVGTGRDFPLAVVLAGAGALVLIAASVVLSRLGQTEAGAALGLAAAGYGGIAGFLAVPAEQMWGWPVAAGALGLIIVGGVELAFTPTKPEIHLVPLAFGASIGLAAVVTAAFSLDPVGPYSIMLAVTAMLANGLPWLALSSTRIQVISPQSDADVFTAPDPIDADDVKRRAAAGARVLVSLRLALGLAALAATPIVAANGLTGALLCALAFLGMMFQSRQTYARAGVMTLMALGAIGLAATGLTVIVTQPDLRIGMLIVLLVGTALLVTLTLLSPRARLRLGRVADTVEVIALALLLPLGVITAGLA
ncbi:type VII secretion integral membrane protein EccD [Leifsonia sp. Leaf264]|uniref:type VII secretion integral membrane protein EccD n=1 Tax=Leifsonia sp. Leaf264 TaxID=1736314 RepID=UPI0006FB498B|nr:type VII secretion integral membrane protein EccD [Leifsonia sp. Leaf264]KQO96863.1 type VII secretion integral membrane protein EccD [Leifsonia sp. Leaf264]